MLEVDTYLNMETLTKIYQAGYSRVPIYEKDRENIVGILLTRELILVNPEKLLITIRMLQTILIKNVVEIDEDSAIEPILTFFKKGHSHMGIVVQ